MLRKRDMQTFLIKVSYLKNAVLLDYHATKKTQKKLMKQCFGKKCKNPILTFFSLDGETRKIEHPLVYAVTASWSVFAYVWLYIILGVISPGKLFLN